MSEVTNYLVGALCLLAGGGVGFALGLWRGKSAATAEVVQASVKDQVAAVTTADDARAAETKKQADLLARLPSETPAEQVEDIKKTEGT